ncbi:bifunctional phosphoribosyl-AMP cyclohydrolase/phosphoribosyl-ATP diphosphatase HisIE [Idiomarina sp. HP20-50]|uniref:bifunctional phosphoribosyl-AMP cyclohydrolase/phosphoribosyl-ATP diphosphatase HisIE n=1 Tax=Idiomarina sp. HP20-50 TaxID=3070813 RepID=UPI00294B0AE5|nr:bifunctional phosphoribosyl-AMP cyclohydrolase/phosphoribosyl-ATP diphosphatase HisIE [Idiomarina sp. HP20-50]MDV6317168.1 bifunctional phosphoribosyl-AMP cyclohydrolase/phosphoribosyl-ATP diphosphatase HisIE [Idiomarina sp. HP20-50]
MKIELETIDQLAWDKMSGLLPCTVQHAFTGEVLMQAYMNKDAIKESLSTGKTTFYSRSKTRLWTKGESSKNYLHLEGIYSDCDNDALLVQALPDGPTCHLGNRSCFTDAPKPLLHELDALIASRKGAEASESYTASLFAEGVKRAAQKVGEEGVEVALAAATEDKNELVNESADLLYHLLVVLQASELSLEDVLEVLAKRRS